MKLMIVVVVLALYGCGGSAFSAAESDGGLGAGAVDTGAVDTGAVDTGAVDTGAVDTGAVDTGGQGDATPMADGGTADDAVVDSSASDSAVAIDSGSLDSSLIDADDACTPVTHNNGGGGSWTDCVPLGTYNETQAMKACEAQISAEGVGLTLSSCTDTACGSGTDTVELQGALDSIPPSTLKVFWTYAGPFAGYMVGGACPTESSQSRNVMWN